MSAIICTVNRRGNAAKLRKTRDIIMRGNIVTSALLVISTAISVFIIFWYKKEQKELLSLLEKTLNNLTLKEYIFLIL